MTTDTKLKELIINKLTTSQYDSIEEKDPNQLYIVTDALGFDNTITSCLIKIPQDIKLELNNGTLTLKAGSKAYVPNGFEDDGTTPKFDVVVIESDIICEGYQTVGTRLMMYNNNNVYGGVSSFVYSGDTSTMNSKTPYAYAFFYNTQTNKMYNGNGNSWNEILLSLPLGMATSNSSSQYDSLDQTFNGFGYIGSTVFYLPNVQGKTANGLNSDGTYKGTDFTTNKVLTRTFSGDNGDRYLAIKGNLSISYNDYDGSNPAYYDKKINQFVRPGDSSPIWDDVCVFGLCTMTNGVISNFRPKTTFQAVDYDEAVKYSDKAEVVGWGMPDYSAGISVNLPYTTPYNGFMYIMSSGSSGGATIVYVDNCKVYYRDVATASYVGCVFPVGKGQIVSLNNSGTIHDIIFYPCIGG